jgi:prophage DNA circulation protein
MSDQGAWYFNLVEASWRGVVFQTKRIRDSRERRWVDHEYPYVDGEDIEDVGRRGRNTSITAVYHGDKYLTELNDLMQKVDDGKAGRFQHPLFGTYTARLSLTGIDHDETMRDTCIVEIAVREDGAGADIDPIQSIWMMKEDVTSAVDEASDALDDVEELLDDIEDAVDTVNDALDEARDFVENATSRITQTVQRMNNVVRKVDKAVKKARRLTDLDSYPLTKALRKIDKSARALGRRVLGTKWPMRSRSIPVDVPACLLAHHLYGDASRADELAELNPGVIRNPGLIPAGTVLRVFNS